MRVLVIDTETELIPEFDKVRPSYTPPPLVVTGWRHLDHSRVCFEYEDTFSQEFLTAVERADRIVLHNAAFDCGVLARADEDLAEMLEEAVLAGRVIDTRILWAMRYPLRDRLGSLDAIHRFLFDQPLQKGDVRTSFRRGVPPNQAQLAYLRQDVDATARVYEKLMQFDWGALAHHPQYRVPRGVADPALADWDPDVAYSTAAALRAFNLETHTLHVDRRKLATVTETTESELRTLQAELAGSGLLNVKYISPANVDEVIDPVGHTNRNIVGPAPARKWQGGVWGVRPVAYRLTASGIEYTTAKFTANEKALRTAFAEIANENKLPVPLTKGGEVSLETKFWRQYKELLPDALVTFLAFKKKEKTLSAFLRPLVNSQSQTVCPQYWIPGAETGRWSCTSPNVQQASKDIKALYSSPYAGEVVVTADYKSLEMFTLANTLAVWGRRGQLLETLERGGDMHRRTYHLMYDVPEDSVTEEQRREAKMANFGLGGGMGPKTFLRHARAQGADWTMTDAVRVSRAWFRAYAEIADFLDFFRVDPYHFKPVNLETWEWVTNLGWKWDDERWPSKFELGRLLNEGRFIDVTLPSGRVIPQRHFSAAANCCFQGPGADVITQAFINCHRAGLTVLAIIHDSVYVSAPADEAEEAGEKLAKAMQDAHKQLCPHVPAPLPEFEIQETL